MISSNIKVSIITVSYNCVKSIESTIQSVVSQVRNEIEYIIIDGESTDGTKEIIKKYNDHITRWISEPDKGVYDAMNKGISLSTGEWLIFINAGDELASTTVLNEIDFSSFNKWDIIYGNHYQVESNNTKLVFPNPFFRNTKKFKNVGICHQSVFVPAQLAKKYLFNLDYKICADFDMLHRMWTNGCNFRYVPITISRFSWGDGLSTKLENIIMVNKENGSITGSLFDPEYLLSQLKCFVKIILKK